MLLGLIRASIRRYEDWEAIRVFCERSAFIDNMVDNWKYQTGSSLIRLGQSSVNTTEPIWTPPWSKYYDLRREPLATCTKGKQMRLLKVKWIIGKEVME